MNNSLCPFAIGDVVKMRKSHLLLRRFDSYHEDDIGIVTDFKLSVKEPDTWLISVYWQNFISSKKPGPQLIKHKRLKKVCKKKND